MRRSMGKVKFVRKIDIEPKWADLCRGASSGHIKPEFLMDACKTTDRIRQAQKSGAKKVIFSFPSRNVTRIKVVK